MRSAVLAADLVLIPVQPSPLDGWASAEMLGLLREARIYRPQLAARFVLKAARAQAGARYDNFIATLGRRLNEGPKLRQEISEDQMERSIDN